MFRWAESKYCHKIYKKLLPSLFLMILCFKRLNAAKIIFYVAKHTFRYFFILFLFYAYQRSFNEENHFLGFLKDYINSLSKNIIFGKTKIHIFYEKYILNVVWLSLWTQITGGVIFIKSFGQSLIFWVKTKFIC